MGGAHRSKTRDVPTVVGNGQDSDKIASIRPKLVILTTHQTKHIHHHLVAPHTNILNLTLLVVVGKYEKSISLKLCIYNLWSVYSTILIEHSLFYKSSHSSGAQSINCTLIYSNRTVTNRCRCSIKLFTLLIYLLPYWYKFLHYYKDIMNSTHVDTLSLPGPRSSICSVWANFTILVNW